MEKTTWIWVVIVVLFLMQQGNISFLGATTEDGWQGILDDLVGTLQEMLTSIMDLAKDNPLITAVIVGGIILVVIGGKKF